VDEKPGEYLIRVDLSDFVVGELTLRGVGPRPVVRVERLGGGNTREPFASHEPREEPMQFVEDDFAKRIVAHCLTGDHAQGCDNGTG
jgi:hypothetical protein